MNHETNVVLYLCCIIILSLGVCKRNLNNANKGCEIYTIRTVYTTKYLKEQHLVLFVSRATCFDPCYWVIIRPRNCKHLYNNR
jgi:hypothetical protein